jgi:hypothetical protein
MAGNKETALKNLEKADKAEGGKKSRPPRFSIKRSLQAKIESEGAEKTISWMKEKHPTKFCDLLGKLLDGEIRTQIKVEGELTGQTIIIQNAPIEKKKS